MAVLLNVWLYNFKALFKDSLCVGPPGILQTILLKHKCTDSCWQPFTTTSKYEILTLTRFHTHLCTCVLEGGGLHKVQTYIYCAL